MGSKQERIDIYDKDRNKTGLTLSRKGEKLNPEQYMLYVLAVLETEDGKILVTRRAMDKKWAPGAWEVPGGGAMAGETSWEAVCREVMEEVGIDLSGKECEPVYSYRNDDPEGGDNYFADLYRIPLRMEEVSVQLQEEEATEFAFAALEEIEEHQKRGKFLHYSRLMKALGK